jgi:hypothetical protein
MGLTSLSRCARGAVLDAGARWVIVDHGALLDRRCHDEARHGLKTSRSFNPARPAFANSKNIQAAATEPPPSGRLVRAPRARRCTRLSGRCAWGTCRRWLPGPRRPPCRRDRWRWQTHAGRARSPDPRRSRCRSWDRSVAQRMGIEKDRSGPHGQLQIGIGPIFADHDDSPPSYIVARRQGSIPRRLSPRTSGGSSGRRSCRPCRPRSSPWTGLPDQRKKGLLCQRRGDGAMREIG